MTSAINSQRTLFRDRNFRLLFTGNALSGVGQGMTIIGTPWYIAHRYGSSHTLGAIMTITLASSLVFAPYVGVLIDRYKRKNLLLIENVCGFLGLGAMALLGVFGGYTLVWLGLAFWFTIMIFNLHFPTTYALSQESFAPELYAHISGVLEVVTQTSAIVAGGAAGVIMERAGLPAIYAIDSATYAIAFFFLLAFRYTPRVGASAAPRRFTAELRLAAAFLRARPRFFLLNVALFIPFVVLVSLDLIYPFYISSVLHAGAVAYSLANLFYAAGATAAGLWMRAFSVTYGERFGYISAFVMFAAALAALALAPPLAAVFAAVLLTGWCNAGVRVNRIAFIMHAVPTELTGRINMYFGWIGTWLRIAALIWLTWAIDAIGAQWCFASMAAALAAALALYLANASKGMKGEIY